MLFEGLFESMVSDNDNAWTELQETKNNFFASHNERMKELNDYIKRIEIQHKEFDAGIPVFEPTKFEPTRFQPTRFEPTRFIPKGCFIDGEERR